MSSEKEGVKFRNPGRSNNSASRPHTIFSGQSISNLFNKNKNTQEYSKSYDNASHGDRDFPYPRKLSNNSVNTIDCVYNANSSFNTLDSHLEDYEANSSIYDTTLHKLTSSSKTSSTGGTSAIIKEGYMNKKTDTNASSVSSSLGRSWRLYYVTLRGAKLIFYKPPTEAEIQSTIAHTTSGFQSSPKAAPASSLTSIDDGPKNMGMFLIPATFDSAARTFLFEPRLIGPNKSQPPLSENYFYGEMFTEVDVRYFKFKRYTSLLIFNDSLMVFKRRWIHNNRSSIFDTVNSAFKLGSSYNTPPDKVDPTKGYYTKWKHHATYPLLDTDVVDASSTSFNPNSPLPAGTPGSNSKSGLYSHNNSSASSVATLSSSNDYSSQLSSGTMQAFQLFVRDKQRTTRLFVASSSDSLASWTNKLQDAKDVLTKKSQKNNSATDSPKSSNLDSAPLSPQLSQDNRSVTEPARVRLFWGLGQHPELVIDTSDKNVVKGGSTDALIHEAIFTSCTGKDYRLAFLYTYKLFTTTAYLCQEIGRYASLLPTFSNDISTDDMKMHNRIAQFLLDLLQFCGPNLSGDDLSIISDLIEDKLEPLKVPKVPELTELWTQTHSIQTKPVMEIENDTSEANTYLQSLTKTGLTPAVFLKLDAIELAQQLYLFHYSAYSQHHVKLSDPCQLLGALPEQVRSFSFTPDQPHFLTKLIYHHLFFATPSSSPSRRAALLNHWIQVGLMCRDHGDMASWIGIAIGVCSPVVTRLSETWRSVDRRLTKMVSKRWVPVLIDIGLYSPVHPGKISVPRCMVLIQEINPKRSASKVVIPFFGPFRQYIARIIDQGGAGAGAFKEKAMGFEQYWEVYQTALSLRKQWPETLKGGLFIEAGCPYKAKKYIQDYFNHISTPNHRGHNSFGSELSLEFDFKVLHQRSLICEAPFVNDYLNFVHDVSLPTPTFGTPFQFPEPITACPTFLDYISSLPLTNRMKGSNAHTIFSSTFASTNLNDPSSYFRKRTQSVPIPSSNVSRDSRKSAALDTDSESRPAKSCIDMSRAKDMIYVQNRSLVLYSIDNDIQDLTHLNESQETSNASFSHNVSLMDLKVQVVAGSPEELTDVLIYGVQDFIQCLTDYEHNPIYLTSDSRLDFDHSGFMDMFFSTYRDFISPQNLFDHLKDNFNRTLSPLMTNQKVEQSVIDISTQDQLKILKVFHYWISYHFYDFFDNPELRNILFAFLYSVSDKMGHILMESTRKLAFELHLTSESKMLTALSVMSRFSFERANVANAQKQLGASPAMESLHIDSPVASPREPVTTLDIDHHSCTQIIDAFHHFIIPMMKKASMKDYMLTFTLLEAQSISTWSWLSPGKPTSAAEDETIISDIFMLLDQCRRRSSILNSSSTPNMNPNSQSQTSSGSGPLVNCDRPLVSLFPRHLSDIWQFRDKIRTWAISQVTSDIDSELRAQRIIKILKMIVICRRQMASIQPKYIKHLERILSVETGILKSSDHDWLPSFVERALVSGLVSSESRSFSYLWAQVANYLGASMDDFGTFISQTQAKFENELENAEVMVPCVGWIFESAIHLIHYIPDHFSLGSHPMINFQKRHYLGRLIQTCCDWINLFNLKQPNRKGFDIIKLLTYLDSLKKPDWIKVRHVASRENQLIKQGSSNTSNYASSIYYYATGHNQARHPKIFMQLVQDQLDKQKQENREREKLMREVKAQQLSMLKQQQEQARILDRQMKDQLNRKAKTKELFIMSTLLKPVNGTSQLSSSPNSNPSNNGLVTSSISQMPNIDSKKPVHVIKLINCRAVVEHTYTKRDFVFRIITEEGGEYLLQCVDRTNMEEWLQVINESAKEAAERRVTLLAEDAKSQLPSESEPTFMTRSLSTNRKSGKGPDRNTVFGVELKRIMKDDQMPVIVTKCIGEVEARGLLEVGIYRIPGSTSGIERLCRAFDRNSDRVDLSSEDWGDINVIACTLKQYLRDLPEPVATYGLYDAFISAVELEDYEERLFAIKDLLPRLPKENYMLLKRIIEHLEKVTDYEEVNHMYATNLAIVFGPSLFAPPPSPNSFVIAMGNLGHQQNLVKNMILQYHWLFDVEEEVDGDDQTTAVVSEEATQATVVADPSFSVDSMLPSDISFDNSIDIGLDTTLNITLPDV